MIIDSLIETGEPAVSLLTFVKRDFAAWQGNQPKSVRDWIEANGFKADAHQTVCIPGTKPQFLVGLGEAEDRWSYCGLPRALPPGIYKLERGLDAARSTRAALGWALGNYEYTEYRSSTAEPRALVWPELANREEVRRTASAVELVRNLINRPANALGPEELADEADKLAKRFGASCTVLVGEELVRQNYPLVHAVGQASARKPRLIDLQWGPVAAPKLTIIGKGVCFDTGGLNLKRSGVINLMKLDMGGAAHALGLACMIMEARLPVRLRMLVPAVENAIGGNAIRPRDIIRSRKGLTVEIGDTDAEGRLILADALTEAASEDPDLILDMATLTGSARVALGTDITALFTPDDNLAKAILDAANETEDPIWRLPLWKPYAKDLEGKIADLNNVADLNLGPTTFAGAIYAALFLAKFVEPVKNWIHLDIAGWNLRGRPGRPEGGDAFGLLAVFHVLATRYRKASEGY